LISTVSFAEFMLQYREGNVSYYQIPPILLKQHAIEKEEQLQALCDKLSSKFHKQD